MYLKPQVHTLAFAVCDENLYAVNMRPGKNTLIRSMVIEYGTPLEDTIEKLLHWTNDIPVVIGVSHHDNVLVDAIKPPRGSTLIAVSPTIATLAGLSLVDNRALPPIRKVKNNDDCLTALLKIGPRKVSWAIEGDNTPTYMDAPQIAQLNPRSADIIGEAIGNVDLLDAISLLGNSAWCNIARYLDAVSSSRGGALASPLTSKLMHQAINRKSMRNLTSHLCWKTIQEHDKFGIQVSRMMADMFGNTLRYVADQVKGRVGTLYVQYNSIAAVTGMAAWMQRNCSLASYLSDAPGLNVRLMDDRPQVPEAIGAAAVAARLAYSVAA